MFASAGRQLVLFPRSTVRSHLWRRAISATPCSLEGRTPTPLVRSDVKPLDQHSKQGKEFKGSVNYFPDFIHAWNKKKFQALGGAMIAGSLASFAVNPVLGAVASGITGGYWYLGIQDLRQTRHTIRRNFPVLGHMRYIFEQLRPEIYQYFVESDQSGVPFNREKRGMAYQRAKNIDATMPFGTKMDVYAEGYEWLNHSLWPQHIDLEDTRTTVGGPSCKQPYSAALLNISAMSYGALSDNAILALNKGAKMGGFYHNTGEGGMSRFHLEPGADLVWNIGTGYFGCGQTVNGVRTFDPAMFADNAQRPNCKMIEIKLSQGAKPAHGGMLPKEKISPAIAEARGLGSPPYEDCNSPPRHSAFSTPFELAEFVTTLRELSGGKPIGMKMCVGRPEEVAALIRAFHEFGPEAAPDFITVDGGEGGTGAAPPEFSNRIGMPLHEGLTVVKGLLRGAGFRTNGKGGHNSHPIKIISSGRVVNGFDLVRLMALGADFCNSARAMMFSLGCIQALMCNTNKCPTGIATNKPHLMAGLDIDDKSVRVAQFQAKTVHTALEIIGACGLDKAHQISTEHIWRRVDGFNAKSFRDMYAEVPIGSLIDSSPGRSGRQKPIFEKWWDSGGMLLNKSHAIGVSIPVPRGDAHKDLN